MSAYLGRGLAAGLVAGLLAAVFAFFVGEPLLDRAVNLEEAGHAADHEEAFTRATQKVGLFVATGLAGSFLGGMFGIAFTVFRERLTARSDWTRSLCLAAVAFVGVVLVPFVKYPANPPTVGDPDTIGVRTVAYFVLIGVSLSAIWVSWYTARAMREGGVAAPVRHLSVGAALVALLVLLLVGLPAADDPGDFPAGLLWSFRLSSLGTQLVLWTGLGVVFGLLCELAERRAERKGGAA